jgi:hypothetical protein
MYSRFSVLIAKQNSNMKTKSSAPIGANPSWDFCKKLPKKAVVLGSKCHRTPMGETIYVCYSFKGKTVDTRFSWKGGML